MWSELAGVILAFRAEIVWTEILIELHFFFCLWYIIYYPAIKKIILHQKAVSECLMSVDRAVNSQIKNMFLCFYVLWDFSLNSCEKGWNCLETGHQPKRDAIPAIDNCNKQTNDLRWREKEQWIIHVSGARINSRTESDWQINIDESINY